MIETAKQTLQAKNILKDSPKATFRILNNGKYYDYTNKVRQ